MESPGTSGFGTVAGFGRSEDVIQINQVQSCFADIIVLHFSIARYSMPAQREGRVAFPGPLRRSPLLYTCIRDLYAVDWRDGSSRVACFPSNYVNEDGCKGVRQMVSIGDSVKDRDTVI